jgi:hypothetical protein
MGSCFSCETTYSKRPRGSNTAPLKLCPHGFNVDTKRTPCPGCKHHIGKSRMHIVPLKGGPRKRKDGLEVVGHLIKTKRARP